MATVTELIGTVYDVLLKDFSLASDTFLQFAWPGIALSPAEFKDPDAPTGPYVPSYAEETFAYLSNIAPSFSQTTFNNPGFEIDDLYQLIISGAMPVGAPPEQLATNPAYKLFSDAQYDFVTAVKGYNKDPNQFYHPCRAFPSDWYTEASAQSWPTFTAGTVPTPPPSTSHPSPFVKNLGALLIAKGLWQVKPLGRPEPTVKLRLQETVQTKENYLSRFIKPFPGKINVRPLEQHSPTLPGGPPRPERTVRAMGAPVLHDQGPLRVSVAVKKTLRPDPLMSSVKLNATVFNKVQIDVNKFEVVANRGMAFNKRLLLNNLLNEQLVGKPPTATASNFSISFRYCRVTIDRPWLKLALLATKNWYMFGTSAGEYSSGLSTNNTGMFPMLPMSFIAIRNLKISGTWSDEDKANAANSVAFGPFDIRGHSIVQNTLEVPGLQIIAWVSRLMPTLPPLKDPVLA